MTELKFRRFVGAQIKLMMELSAPLRRNLVAFATVLEREMGQAVRETAKMFAPVLKRFKNTDLSFPKRRAKHNADFTRRANPKQQSKRSPGYQERRVTSNTYGRLRRIGNIAITFGEKFSRLRYSETCRIPEQVKGRCHIRSSEISIILQKQAKTSTRP